MKNIQNDFIKAFDEYADALYRHTYFKVGNKDVAQDLVQDTFMKVWDSVREKHNANIKSWRALLYTALNRLIIDYYRKKKSASLDEILENDTYNHCEQLLSDEDNIHNFEKEFDAKKEVAMLYACLDKLPKQEKDIIILRFIDGLSGKEVAKILQISVASVHTKLHRAKKKLERMFDNINKNKSI